MIPSYDDLDRMLREKQKENRELELERGIVGTWNSVSECWEVLDSDDDLTTITKLDGTLIKVDMGNFAFGPGAGVLIDFPFGQPTVQGKDPFYGNAFAGDSGGKLKVTANDTTPDYLLNKLVAGSNITLTEVDDGTNETLEISASGGGSTSWSGAIATKGSSQTITGGVNTVLAFSGGIADTDGYQPVFKDRMIIPSGFDGRFIATAVLFFGNGSNLAVQGLTAQIAVNSTTINNYPVAHENRYMYNYLNSANNQCGFTLTSIPMKLVAGDIVRVVVQLTSGTISFLHNPKPVGVNPEPNVYYYPMFSLYRIGDD